MTLINWICWILDVLDYFSWYIFSYICSIITFNSPATSDSSPAKGKANHFVVVTGSSSGIGLAAVQKISQLGYSVFACVRDVKSATSAGVFEGLRNVHMIQLDVCDSSSITKALAQVHRELEAGVPTSPGPCRLVALINNAGAPCHSPVEMLEPEKSFLPAFQTNVLGLQKVTRAFLPLLREFGAARIINVSSVAGFMAAPGIGGYAATKHAVEGLSDSLRQELIPFGIKVSILEPGYVETKFSQKSREMISGGSGSVAPHPIYESFIRSSGKRFDKLRKFGVTVEATNRAIEHALSSPWPKIRYQIGLDARLWRFVSWFLPDTLRDAMISHAFYGNLNIKVKQ